MRLLDHINQRHLRKGYFVLSGLAKARQESTFADYPRKVSAEDHFENGNLNPVNSLRNMATPAGLEPATCRLEGGCSIQLSYGVLPGAIRSAAPV